METVPVLNNQENEYTIDDAMQTLLEKLDDAIDDYENGRVITENEMWAELDKI